MSSGARTAGTSTAATTSPLTLLVRTLVLESDPSTTWLRWLSGDRNAVPSEEHPAEERPETRPRRQRSARDHRSGDR
ncbi:hypothetical protein B2G67_06905 [Microbacterium foliorum]|nr:hypothetical protein B2G67_06905 [Microbacterium foliorum]